MSERVRERGGVEGERECESESPKRDGEKESERAVLGTITNNYTVIIMMMITTVAIMITVSGRER